MEVEKETKIIRKALANDLKEYYVLVKSYLDTKIIKSDYETALTTLNNVDKCCCIDKDFQPTYWNYKINHIEFKLDNDIPKKKLPNSAYDLKLIASIDISGDTDKTDERDPFKTLSFNFIIKGDFLCKKTGNIKTAMTTYHLDRHLHSDGDNEAKEPHPFYHLQFGGKKLIDEYGDKIDTGELLVLETPRIPHHPMELILGLDYLISNFYPSIRKRLMNEKQEYRKIIEKYQERILKPYYSSITSRWEESLTLYSLKPNWTPNSLNPQIC